MSLCGRLCCCCEWSCVWASRRALCLCFDTYPTPFCSVPYLCWPGCPLTLLCVLAIPPPRRTYLSVRVPARMVVRERLVLVVVVCGHLCCCCVWPSVCLSLLPSLLPSLFPSGSNLCGRLFCRLCGHCVSASTPIPPPCTSVSSLLARLSFDTPLYAGYPPPRPPSLPCPVCEGLHDVSGAPPWQDRPCE